MVRRPGIRYAAYSKPKLPSSSFLSAVTPYRPRQGMAEERVNNVNGMLWLKVNLLPAPLRSDRRFSDLVRRIKDALGEHHDVIAVAVRTRQSGRSSS